MFIHAGRTQNSRYDNRAPIHLAIARDSGSSAYSICSEAVVQPITRAPKIDVTCRRCIEKLSELPELLADQETLCTAAC